MRIMDREEWRGNLKDDGELEREKRGKEPISHS